MISFSHPHRFIGTKATNHYQSTLPNINISQRGSSIELYLNLNHKMCNENIVLNSHIAYRYNGIAYISGYPDNNYLNKHINCL